jgi:hypothetical protein
MKKTTLLLAGLCAFSLCTWEAQAVNLEHASIINMNTADNVPTGYEIIELQGDFDDHVGPNAVIAGANENSVYIHFNLNLGNVNISIYNASSNLVYSNVVDTSVQQTMIIPISSTFSGTYTIVLNNANGYAEGDFERN